MQRVHLVQGTLLSSYPRHLRKVLPTGTQIPILQMKTLRLNKVQRLAEVLGAARKGVGTKWGCAQGLTPEPVATSPLGHQATRAPVPVLASVSDTV